MTGGGQKLEEALAQQTKGVKGRGSLRRAAAWDDTAPRGGYKDGCTRATCTKYPKCRGGNSGGRTKNSAWGVNLPTVIENVKEKKKKQCQGQGKRRNLQPFESGAGPGSADNPSHGPRKMPDGKLRLVTVGDAKNKSGSSGGTGKGKNVPNEKGNRRAPREEKRITTTKGEGESWPKEGYASTSKDRTQKHV